MLKTLNFLKERTSTQVVVDSGTTSTGWWRRWSDGLIEQGGTVNATDNSYMSATVSLSVRFSRTDYVALVTGVCRATTDYGTNYVTDKTTTSFVAISHNSSSKPTWYAAGY